MDAFENVRRQFPVCQSSTYLDCAYDCGGSLFSRASAEEYYNDWHKAAAKGLKGGPGRQPFFDKAEALREKICTLVGGQSPREVCFTRNTNEGINHILMGFQGFGPGSAVMTSSIEHPSVLMPCINAAHMRGFECIVLEPENGEYPTAQMYMKAWTPRVKMIVLSHVQSSNGYKTDLEALGAFCREKGVWLVVDAIQSLGFGPFDASKWGVSAVSAAGYKGLMACESTGFLWCRRDLLEMTAPTYTAAGFVMGSQRGEKGWEITCRDKKDARKFENSSLDAPGIYSLDAGISCVLGLGVNNISEHIRGLYDVLYNGLLDLGITPVTPLSPCESCASIAFDTPKRPQLQEIFEKRNISCSFSRLIRLSLGAFNNEEDIKAVLSAVKEVLEE